ncbi:MAG: TPM domain-containing protein, partial [Betaproteobacteria bacterium]|nr:TPM domain-containing protein [Betaproteobacteria bacterium]
MIARVLRAAAVLLAIAASCAGVARAQDVLPVPALTAHVIDQTATLDAAAQAALEARLTAFEQQRGTQIVVLLVPTTQPEDIAAYAQRVGDQWKIGRAKVGDGLLLVVAKNDHKVRIEVTKALEGAVPDVLAKRIIRERIGPKFAAGDFVGGLNDGLDALTALITNEKLPGVDYAAGQPHGDARSNGGAGPFDNLLPAVMAGLFAGFVLSRVLGRVLGTLGSAAVAGFVGMTLTGSLLLALAAGALSLV